MAYELIIDGAALQEVLAGPDGPVVRHANRIGDEIIALARTKINRRFTGPVQSGAGGVTLGNTLVKRWGIGPHGPALTIEAKAPYALLVHEGNKSNRGDGRIWPTRATNTRGTGPPMLRFVSAGGGFVFARSVRESRPNPFLRDATVEVLAGSS